MRKPSVLMVTLLALGLSACAARSTPPAPVSSTQGTSIVQTAEVTDVRDVTVRGGGSSGIGSFVGGVLGGIAGSQLGGGHGRTVAAIGGAIAGGAAGHQIEESGVVTKTTALTLRFPNGDVRTYDIGPEETYRVGDVVKVTTTQGLVRITR